MALMYISARELHASPFTTVDDCGTLREPAPNMKTSTTSTAPRAAAATMRHAAAEDRCAQRDGRRRRGAEQTVALPTPCHVL